MRRKTGRKKAQGRWKYWLLGIGVLGVGIGGYYLYGLGKRSPNQQRQPTQEESYEQQQARLRDQAVAAWWAMSQQGQQPPVEKRPTPAPPTSETQGPALQVVHVSDITSLDVLHNFAETRANVESISASGAGYFVFYRTTEVKYEYRAIVVSGDVERPLILQKDTVLPALLRHGWVIADGARNDRTFSDQRIFLIKQRADEKPIEGLTGKALKVAGIISPHFTDIGTELGERFSRVLIHSFSEWDPYEVVYSDLDSQDRYEYQIHTMPTSAVPATDVSAIMLRVQEEELKGWKFLKADLQDAWQDSVVFVFFRRLSTQK